MIKKRHPRSIAHPLYWLTWVGLGVFWLLNLLPWSVKRFLARGLGHFAYYIVPLRRRVVHINLRLAFPNKSDAERSRLARDHYQSLALGLFETIAAWWSPSHRLPPHRVEGIEHLEQALASGRGALINTAHVTVMELAGRMMNDRLSISGLYRNPNNPVVAWAMRRAREKQIRAAIPFEDLKGLIRALRAGHIIWYASDQSKQTKFSEILPFFGEPAITNTATSKIVLMSKCQVIPYFAYRDDDGSYVLKVYPPLEDFPSDDHSADALRISVFIEEHVREHPEQYFWVHQRYKRRGPDYPDVYA